MRLTTKKSRFIYPSCLNIFEKFPVIEYVFKFRFEESKNKTLISLVTQATFPCQEPHVTRCLCVSANVKPLAQCMMDGKCSVADSVLLLLIEKYRIIADCSDSCRLPAVFMCCLHTHPAPWFACWLPPPEENKQTNKKKQKNIYSCFPCHNGLEARWADVTHWGRELREGSQGTWRLRPSLPAAPRGLWWQPSIGVTGLTPVPFQTAPIAHTEHQPSVWTMSQAREYVCIRHCSRCRKDTERKGMSQSMLVLWLYFHSSLINK